MFLDCNEVMEKEEYSSVSSSSMNAEKCSYILAKQSQKQPSQTTIAKKFIKHNHISPRRRKCSSFLEKEENKGLKQKESDDFIRSSSLVPQRYIPPVLSDFSGPLQDKIKSKFTLKPYN